MLDVIAQRVRRFVTILLLLAFFAMGMAQVRATSITFDEGPHLAVGYTTLRTRDLRLQPVHIHPPLANVVAGLPLLLQPDLPDPALVEGWGSASLSAITDAVVWQYPHPARIATAGRVPILLLSTLLVALGSRWAGHLGGRCAGLIALFCLALDPNLIAHGALITTDAVAVLLIVATLYAMSRWTETPENGADRFLWFAATGVLLGLAQLAKVSAISLVPVVGLVLLAQAWQRVPPLSAVARSIAQFAGMVAIAALVLWAGYGFELVAVPGIAFRVPAGTHLMIYRSLGEHYALGHPTFALGRVSDHGWWWYFPAAFAVKTPVPILMLLAGAGVVGGRLLIRRVRAGTLQWRRISARVLALGLFPTVYAASSLCSSVNIGYRHLLPLLPFLYVGAAQIVVRSPMRHSAMASVRRMVGTAAFAWLALGTVAALPAPLAYFNEFAGGPAGGHRYLVDSNLDWGQNLWDLASWMADHGESHVNYAHYSPARPEAYGIDADFLPPDPRAIPFTPWRPEPGLYAIGATVLQGPYAPDLNTYAWFRSREPDAVLGDALFVYRVRERSNAEWLAVCHPADAALARERLGLPSIRTLAYDCAQVQVYPGDAGLVLAPDDFAPVAPNAVELTLRTDQGAADLTLSRIDDRAQPPVDWPETQLEGPLAFVGYGTSKQTGKLRLDAYWQVTEVPTRPLSLMAHLVPVGGGDVVAGDGLGFPVDQWLPGDLIVQHHVLESPGDAADQHHQIHVGAYWLDTLERMPLADRSEQDSIVLPMDNAGMPDDR